MAPVSKFCWKGEFRNNTGTREQGGGHHRHFSPIAEAVCNKGGEEVVQTGMDELEGWSPLNAHKNVQVWVWHRKAP